jgi:hypothetical protein
VLRDVGNLGDYWVVIPIMEAFYVLLLNVLHTYHKLIAFLVISQQTKHAIQGIFLALIIAAKGEYGGVVMSL